MSFQEGARGFFAAVSRAFAFMRVALANLIIALLLLLVVVLLFASPGAVDVPQGAALVIAPRGSIVEQPTQPNPISRLLGGAATGEVKAVDVLDAIEHATTDERIELLALDVTDLAYASTAQLDAIGAAIQAFRDTGKTVVAASDYYTQQQYYLASFADEVYMHPMGQLMLTGFGAYQDYYQGLLERLKINVHVFRVGTYKSAVEPFIRSDMSVAAKQANQALVDDLWRHYVNQVASNRGLEPAAFQRYADDYDELLKAVGGDMARAALENGLVDELLTNEALEDRLVAKVGEADNGSFLRVGLGNYLRAIRGPKLPSSRDQVAVIVADGMILMGDQPRGTVGSRSTVKLIRRAREDDAVKAIVLRVDSPGGSAFASEVIRQELEVAQMTGKPVIASMGGVAASGGYWISATADEIWASPTTITGSIGVFGIVPTFEDSMSSIGVERDGVGTSTLSGALDPFNGISERMGNILQSTVESTYERFLNLVARGRDMVPEEVDAIGQGRVWTGRKALELGLVDQLGHLNQAIEAAAARAGLDDYEVVTIEKPLTPQEQLLAQIIDSFGLTGVSSPRLEKVLSPLKWLDALNDPAHVYAICESCRL